MNPEPMNMNRTQNQHDQFRPRHVRDLLRHPIPPRPLWQHPLLPLTFGLLLEVFKVALFGALCYVLLVLVLVL